MSSLLDKVVELGMMKLRFKCIFIFLPIFVSKSITIRIGHGFINALHYAIRARKLLETVYLANFIIFVCKAMFQTLIKRVNNPNELYGMAKMNH